MTTNEVPSGAIVVGVDGSTASQAALHWAVREATLRDLWVHVLHATDAAPWLTADYAREPRAVDPVISAALRDVRRRVPGLVATWSEPLGSPIPALIDASRIADTIVVGGRGAGAISSAVKGSIAVQVGAQARCPVVVVRAPLVARAVDAAVAVGVDDNRQMDLVLAYAFAEASRRGVPLVAVHAWQQDPGAYVSGLPMWAEGEDGFRQERELLRRCLNGWVERFPEVEVRRRTLRTGAVEALVRQSEDACLLVVGTRGGHELGGLLFGSVSQRVLRHAYCPVVLVHAPRGTSIGIADHSAVTA
ncbi:universal stress protein [Luteipulveratus mongoliensis]|uniref:UspA domain-containing protein n=1 Tax=Luteipulveratus mongoliensis TaxID=571913 RepID=A0A0K1JFG8_9MICO|nr:universal stress protein [Luteipulveratus mongoliensis]AKU15467.1 hypothetical protein VV02_05615 [Luteipulveratus mongoliensis]